MNWQTIATLSVGRMLNWVVVGIAIAIFVEILLRMAKRRNSGTRFAVWFSALLTIALVPFAGYLAPRIHLADGVSHPRVLLPASWGIYLLTAWVSLMVLGLCRVGFGLWQVHRLRQASIPIPFFSLPTLLRDRLQARRGRRVRLYQSSAVHVPIAVGFMPAAIILPSWTLKELSLAELDAVLLHELAHIDRWDDWTNLVQRVISTIFFFNPAVWWIENRLTLEREMSCDDVVLKKTSNPQGYAHCLVSLAEKSFARRGLSLAQAAVTRMQQTARRISQILDVNRPGAITVSKPVLALVALFSLSSLFVVSRLPQLVAFDGSSATAVQPKQILSSQASSAPEARTLRDTPTLVAGTAHASRAVIPKVSTASESSIRPDVHATRFVQKSAPSARAQMATAGAKDPHSPIANGDTYFVVVQAGYTPSGETFLTIRLVQLTVFHPTGSRTQQDFPTTI